MKTGKCGLILSIIAGLAFNTAALAGEMDKAVADEKGSVYSGDHKHRDARHHHGRMMARMAEELALTEDQTSRIKEIHAAAREQSEDLRREYRDNKRAEREAFESGAAEAELKSLAAKTADSRVDLLLHRRSTMEKVEGVFTAEQHAKLEEMKAERKAKMDARKEKRMEKMQEEQGEDAS